MQISHSVAAYYKVANLNRSLIQQLWSFFLEKWFVLTTLFQPSFFNQIEMMV